MGLAALNNWIKARFLSSYENDPFVIQQKALVLLWLQLILVPVIAGYFIIQVLWLSWPDIIPTITIDLVFIASMMAGIVLIARNRYHAAVYLIISVITVLTILGLCAEKDAQIATGYNNFMVLMLGVVAFTALFSQKKLLIGISLFFCAVLVINFIIIHPLVSSELKLYHVSAFMNVLIVLIIVSCLAFFTEIFTNKALRRTQEELEKNIELRETLEDKVIERTKELQEHVDHIKVLKELLPICASCKKIRDDNGYWNQLEVYFRDNSEIEFSHSICPACVQKLYPELFENEEGKGRA